MTPFVQLDAWVKALVPWIRLSVVPWIKVHPMEALAGLFVLGQLFGKLADLIPVSHKRVRLLEDRLLHMERVLAQRTPPPPDDDPDDDDDDDEPELPVRTLEEQLRELLADPQKVAEFRAAMSGNQIQEPPRRTWHEHLSDDEEKV
jgi:hypothetical protein